MPLFNTKKPATFLLIALLYSTECLAVKSATPKPNYMDYYEYNYAELSNSCQVYDPYEPVNRGFFFFNGVLDTFLLRPIAKGYKKATNIYTRNRVDNFLNNIREPLSTVNYALQGRAEGSVKTLWRFLINSTLGLAGTFDIASKFGLNAAAQTFGNTLEYYGVGPGPYLVVPFVGGIGSRDLMDVIILNTNMNPAMYPIHRDFRNILTAGEVVRSRNEKMPFTDYVWENSPDPYIAIRDAVMHERESKHQYPQGYICPAVKR